MVKAGYINKIPRILKVPFFTGNESVRPRKEPKARKEKRRGSKTKSKRPTNDEDEEDSDSGSQFRYQYSTVIPHPTKSISEEGSRRFRDFNSATSLRFSLAAPVRIALFILLRVAIVNLLV